jgi:GTP-binding protein
LQLVEGTCEHAGKAYKTVRNELVAYGQGLADKREIVALNKADALMPEQLKEQMARLKRAAEATPLVMSAVTHQGVPEVLRALRKAVDVLADVAEAPQELGARASRPLFGTK